MAGQDSYTRSVSRLNSSVGNELAAEGLAESTSVSESSSAFELF